MDSYCVCERSTEISALAILSHMMLFKVWFTKMVLEFYTILSM